jgi:histidine triad (HIT) family protein
MARPCLFCSIVNSKLPAIIIYEDDDHIALMDKYPLNLGHALVIPKLHHENLLSMSPYQVGSLYSVVHMISKAITSAVNADGFSVGQNNGRAANQIVPHVHVHIVPRFTNDSQEGRWPVRTVGNPEQMVQTAHKIQSALDAYKRTEISQYRS